jgi:hypothetical protein
MVFCSPLLLVLLVKKINRLRAQREKEIEAFFFLFSFAPCSLSKK